MMKKSEYGETYEETHREKTGASGGLPHFFKDRAASVQRLPSVDHIITERNLGRDSQNYGDQGDRQRGKHNLGLTSPDEKLPSFLGHQGPFRPFSGKRAKSRPRL